ncbi:MAG: FkbM family methyltransferase [Nitrososphaerota archaeon]
MVAVVGAFVGYYVLIASKMVGSKGKVLAFEPEPRNFAILLKNIRDNELTDVVIPLRLALSDKDGYELLTLSFHPLCTQWFLFFTYLMLIRTQK